MCAHAAVRVRAAMCGHRDAEHRAADAVAECRGGRAVLDEVGEPGVLPCFGEEDVSAGDGWGGAESDRVQRWIVRDLEKGGVPDGWEFSVDRLERGCLCKGKYKLGNARDSVGR